MSGSPRTSGTTGVATDMFFADGLAGSETREMNRKVRCVHVVRDGFASGPALSSAPSEFETVWSDLGLTSEPSLYALIELEPASDRSAHFRGRLTRLLLNRNELAGLEGGTRDMMLFLEFSSPTAGATVTEDELGNKFVQPGGPFAVGMIPLPGVEKGRIQTIRELKGVQTSWMSSPAAGEGDGDFPFNLHIDVVEMKRGNPMMADIGRMLQSEAIVSRVEDEVAYAINPEPRRRQQSDTVFEQRRAQRRLLRELEDASLSLKRLLDQGAGPGELLQARRIVEDALLEIERQQELEGWEGTKPNADIRGAEALVQQARR